MAPGRGSSSQRFDGNHMLRRVSGSPEGLRLPLQSQTLTFLNQVLLLLTVILLGTLCCKVVRPMVQRGTQQQLKRTQAPPGGRRWSPALPSPRALLVTNRQSSIFEKLLVAASG